MTRQYIRFSLFLAVVPVVSAQCRHATAASALEQAVQAEVRKLKSTQVSVFVVNSRGETLLAINEDRPMKPASTMKILTTIAALDVLGATTHLTTNLVAVGAIQGATLTGDLVIEGSGDPTISGRLFKNNPHRIFREWAGRLRLRGIRHISGDIIGDDRCFDDQRLAAGWELTDLTTWYAARVTGLAFNDNCLDLLWKPAKEAGSPATFTLDPPCRFFQVTNRVTTVANGGGGRVGYAYPGADEQVEASGTIGPKPSVRRETIAVPNPTWWAAASLAEVLLQEGITIGGKPLDIDLVDQNRWTDRPREVVASYSSPPVAELVKIMNYRSQNLFAELLLKQVGRVAQGKGTFAAGAASVRSSLSQRGVDVSNLYQVDGSGLSHDNRVTARLMASALAQAHDFAPFVDSLPQAGEKTSSMRFYLNGDKTQLAARERVRGKTGKIKSVRGLCGYAQLPDGSWRAFAVLMNGLPNRPGAGKDVIDRIVTAIAMK